MSSSRHSGDLIMARTANTGCKRLAWRRGDIMAYRFTVYPAEGDDLPVVTLVDDDEDGLTVAENPHAVLRDLVARGFDMARCCFLYRKPLRGWDELALELPAQLLGFLPIAAGERTEAEAVEAVRDSYRPLDMNSQAFLGESLRHGDNVPPAQGELLLFPGRGRAGGRMSQESAPPGGPGCGEDEPSDAEIIALTIRHGADDAKRYLNAIALERAARGIEDDA
jgi:hypothetical protein